MQIAAMITRIHEAQRFERLLYVKPLIDASRTYRNVLMESKRDLTPFCPTYDAVSKVMETIDEMTGHVVGDKTIFHDKGTTPIRKGS